MKKVLLVCTLALVSIFSFAQSESYPKGFGTKNRVWDHQLLHPPFSEN